MPETTPENTIASAWPHAHQAAAEQLVGIGPNEPAKRRGALQARCREAAATAFAERGIAFARVAVAIVWGHSSPTVKLELITPAGERHGGGATLDPRLTPSSTPELAPPPAPADPRDIVETTPDTPPATPEQVEKFYADLADAEDARQARLAERTPS